MASNTQHAAGNTGGGSIVGLLGVAFIVLKLTGVIHWSWWLVLLPFWGGFVLWLVAAMILLAVAAAHASRH